MRKKSTWMNLVIPRGALGKYWPHPYVGSIDLDDELSRGIRSDQNGSGGEQPLEVIKRVLSHLGPGKMRPDWGERCQRGGNLAKTTDKPAVEISEPQKTLECNARVRNGPFYDCTNLVGVHADPLCWHNRSEERYRSRVEHTLLCLNKKAILE